MSRTTFPSETPADAPPTKARPTEPDIAPAWGDRDRVVMDGQCMMCRRLRRWVERLEWSDRFVWVDGSDPNDLARWRTDLTLEQSLTTMVTVRPDGRRDFGFDGVRRVLWRMHLGWPLALLLGLPGIYALGWRFYRHIAARRRRLGCGGPTCGISDTSDRPGRATHQH
ncbi:MAG: DUF393 domain-containing protein [Phycisphaeraceae bacterium]|nr:DUF393 domain-containing protein [Phycisphaeraceae bacterium]